MPPLRQDHPEDPLDGVRPELLVPFQGAYLRAYPPKAPAGGLPAGARNRLTLIAARALGREIGRDDLLRTAAALAGCAQLAAARATLGELCGARKVDWVLLAQGSYCVVARGLRPIEELAEHLAAQLELVIAGVARIVSEDPRERRDALEPYWPALHGLAAHLASQAERHDLAEDLCAQAALALTRWIERERDLFAAGERGRLPAPEAEPERPLLSYVRTAATREMWKLLEREQRERGALQTLAELAREVLPDVESARAGLPACAGQAESDALELRPLERLQARRWEVALLKRLRLTNKQIAAALRVTVRTVEQAFKNSDDWLDGDAGPEGDVA